MFAKPLHRGNRRSWDPLFLRHAQRIHEESVEWTDLIKLAAISAQN